MQPQIETPKQKIDECDKSDVAGLTELVQAVDEKGASFLAAGEESHEVKAKLGEKVTKRASNSIV